MGAVLGAANDETNNVAVTLAVVGVDASDDGKVITSARDCCCCC